MQISIKNGLTLRQFSIHTQLISQTNKKNVQFNKPTLACHSHNQSANKQYTVKYLLNEIYASFDTLLISLSSRHLPSLFHVSLFLQPINIVSREKCFCSLFFFREFIISSILFKDQSINWHKASFKKTQKCEREEIKWKILSDFHSHLSFKL